MNRALAAATVGCLAVAFGYLGVGVLSSLEDEAPVSVDQDLSRRPATKSTCPQAIVTRPPVGMGVSERKLVPFSSTQLGVNTVISDATEAARASSRSRMIEVVSGGYVDELTESYDNLRLAGTVSVTGQPVDLLAGSFLTSTVKVAIWRQPGVAPPCDVHAVLATNLSKQQFKAILTSVRMDHSLASTSRPGGPTHRDLQ
jgi:hypothetical protein